MKIGTVLKYQRKIILSNCTDKLYCIHCHLTQIVTDRIFCIVIKSDGELLKCSEYSEVSLSLPQTILKHCVMMFTEHHKDSKILQIGTYLKLLDLFFLELLRSLFKCPSSNQASLRLLKKQYICQV